MRVVDGEVKVGDVLSYDVRVMAGYGWGYTAQATVLAVDGERVRIAYMTRRPWTGSGRASWVAGRTVRRWVDRRFLYRAEPD